MFVTHGTPMWNFRGYSLQKHQGQLPIVCDVKVNSLDVSSCDIHKGIWDISPNPLIPSQISVPLILFQISVITDQLNSAHRGVRSGECLSQMALPCGLLEATTSRNTRVNSPQCVTSSSTPFMCPDVLSTRDTFSCDFHKRHWDISPKPLIPLE